MVWPCYDQQGNKVWFFFRSSVTLFKLFTLSSSFLCPAKVPHAPSSTVAPILYQLLTHCSNVTENNHSEISSVWLLIHKKKPRLKLDI